MVYLTSDLHGYPLDKFKALLDRAGFSDDDFLFVLGDVIDRGECSVELLKWLMMMPNAELILGNHEAMLLSCAFIFDEVTESTVDAFSSFSLRKLAVWQENGGDVTMRELQRETPETRADILEYLKDCPLYDAVTVGGRDFLLVHGGLGGFDEGRALDDYSEHDLLWTRPELDTVYSRRFTTVIGHTPTVYYDRSFRGRCIITDTWIDIDTGAAFGLSPMLLRLDDMKEFYTDEA